MSGVMNRFRPRLLLRTAGSGNKAAIIIVIVAVVIIADNKSPAIPTGRSDVVFSNQPIIIGNAYA